MHDQVVLSTPGASLRVSFDAEAYQRAWYYASALFLQTTARLKVQGEQYAFGFLERELLLDQHQHSLAPMEIEQFLRNPLPYPLTETESAADADELPELRLFLNFNCLPDKLGEIGYEPILGQAQGALAGLVLLLTVPTSGYYTPGQAVDLRHCISYCSGSLDLIQAPEVREFIHQLWAFLTGAVNLKSGVLIEGPFAQEDQGLGERFE